MTEQVSDARWLVHTFGAWLDIRDEVDRHRRRGEGYVPSDLLRQAAQAEDSLVESLEKVLANRSPNETA